MTVSLKLLVLSVCILVLTKWSKAICPDDEIIEPCTCYLDNFECTGSTIVNYKTLFDRISKDLTLSVSTKVFHTLTLSNQAITEIVDDEFRDLTFTEISIKNANNLKRIYAHAFTTIADKVETFQQSGPSLLGDEDVYVPELFQALSSLVNVRSILLGQTKIKYIPANAFSNINQNKLTHLEINSGMISKIGDYAFYYLNGLTYLRLQNQQINHIVMHAFDLEKSSTTTLEIHLNNNQIEDSGLEVNAFVGTKRPLSLNLANNILTHLKEDVYKPILTANANTRIDVKNNPFKCNCEVMWLVLGKSQYLTRIVNPVCTDAPHNSSALFDLKRSDFNDCAGYFQ